MGHGHAEGRSYSWDRGNHRSVMRVVAVVAVLENVGVGQSDGREEQWRACGTWRLWWWRHLQQMIETDASKRKEKYGSNDTCPVLQTQGEKFWQMRE